MIEIDVGLSHRSLEYTQVIRGPKWTASHYGVLDLKTTAKILTAILLFRETKYAGWTKEYDDGMVKWSNDFIHWLETDHFGKEESETPNNHGSFFFNVCRGTLTSVSEG